jgi:uncharacterized damage-inducible protein DinB
MTPIPRPAPDEYAPYYGTYISKVPDGDLVTTLTRLRDGTSQLLASIPESKAGHRYAPGKWSIREIIGHLSDAERIFAYRMLRIGRNDPTPLASFDENHYVPAGQFERRSLEDVAGEFRGVRDATLSLVRSFDPEAPARRGIASGKEVSARAMAWIIAGHEIHHLAVLRERYL